MSNVAVHLPHGGASLEIDSGGAVNVASGGAVNVASGGQITDDGTQASAIADISESESVFSAAERVKFNAVLAALRGVGVIAAA